MRTAGFIVALAFLAAVPVVAAELKSKEAASAEAQYQASLRAATLKYIQDLKRARLALDAKGRATSDGTVKEAMKQESGAIAHKITQLQEEVPSRGPKPAVALPPGTVRFPASIPWTPAGPVKAGTYVALKASGEWKKKDGTVYVAKKLRGRIGSQLCLFDEEAFISVAQDGILELGIDDDHPGDKSGELTVQIHRLRPEDIVKVPANVPWTPAGAVKAGTSLRVCVLGGQWQGGGYANQKGRLLARVGPQVFFIDREASITVPQDGVLEVGVSNSKFRDGIGELYVEITPPLRQAPSEPPSPFKSDAAKKAEAEYEAAVKEAKIRYGQELFKSKTALESRMAAATAALAKEALKKEIDLITEELVRLHQEVKEDAPAPKAPEPAPQ